MNRPLSRQTASAAVTDLGWRYVLNALHTCIPVVSLAQAAEVAARVTAAGGPQAGERLQIDLRRDRVILVVQTLASARVTEADTELARRISSTVNALALSTRADVGGARSVQAIEIAIDALDIPSVRPFWKAALGYVDEPGNAAPTAAIVDPVGQAPAVWFQQMDAPRPQRNRIHLDISVPHDEAQRRIDAATAAGGVLLSEVSAPAFWVLADPEGNEACISTWQGRD